MELNKLNKEVKKCDILFGIAFVLFLLSHFFTVLIVTSIQEDTGVQIEQINRVIETNPLARVVLNLHHMQYILQFVFVPALVATIYFIFRKRVLEMKTELLTFQYYIFLAFFIYLIVVVNDGGTLAGRLLQ